MNTANAVTTAYKHIHLDEEGVAFVAGTTMKVIELVMAQIAYGWSPEELHFQHPYLTMSQVYSALAYYWEHKDTFDAEMGRRLRYAEQSRQATGPSPLARRLREEGLLE
ncbi:MAG: DUF433 domain-containing protein [Ardenticatenales bacterium]|nr:DUF433 domain-containing protein [Ardenticatenales bacterium]